MTAVTKIVFLGASSASFGISMFRDLFSTMIWPAVAWFWSAGTPSGWRVPNAWQNCSTRNPARG